MPPDPGSCSNLTAAGVRQRRMFGVAMALVAVAGAVAAVWLRIPRLARLGLVVPFFLAGLGLLQARARTCVVLAAKDRREGAAGVEPVADPDEAARLRAVGARVIRLSLLLALVATGVVVALP